jgi:carbonic anhydrase
MDARLDTIASTGLKEGDARTWLPFVDRALLTSATDHIRNAGGVLDPGAIRSLIISQQLLGTSSLSLTPSGFPTYEHCMVHLKSAHFALLTPPRQTNPTLFVSVLIALLSPTGTRQITVIRHTGCGMLTFTTPQARELVKQNVPAHTHATVDELDFLEFSDLEGSVRKDVEVLKNHPLILPETEVSGYIYHVETGKLEKVA